MLFSLNDHRGIRGCGVEDGAGRDRGRETGGEVRQRVRGIKEGGAMDGAEERRGETTQNTQSDIAITVGAPRSVEGRAHLL